MNASSNALMGTAFILLALFLTFLMFYLWKFPFDHEKNQSAAPKYLVQLHRIMGYVYLFLYVFLMWDMVPRLWSYQIELPARSVLHLSLGLAIGAILFIKIIVVRYFKHMEARLAPMLGTSLLICTLLLTGLALPYTAREAYLRITAQDGQNFSAERIARVKQYLPEIGFEDKAGLLELASSAGLADGRIVLTKKCTQCHDLRTILAKPRTPESWQKTVSRMSNRSTILTPISESEQWQVTAYLIAISPTLQEVISERRTLDLQTEASETAAFDAGNNTLSPNKNYNEKAAMALFEQKCSQCHASSLVENSDISSRSDVIELVSRMVDNGLTANDAELSQIMTYLSARFVEPESNNDAKPASGVNSTKRQAIPKTQAKAKVKVENNKRY